MTTIYSSIYKTRQLLVLLVAFCFLSSCETYLDKKPLKTDVVPSTLKDLQALLDNSTPIMNTRGIAYGELMGDDTYVTSSDYNSNVSNPENTLYIWNKDYVFTSQWRLAYTGPIYYANVVLDQLSLVTIAAAEAEQKKNLEGAALFYRAFHFQELAQVFCKPYSASASTDPGIILKLTSNINEVTSRGTVQSTYDQITSDLKKAVDLLPLSVSFPTRPNRAAAYALLARTYLCMGDYAEAGQYADQALQLYNKLMDYNTLVPVGAPPVKSYNAEVIFSNIASNVTINYPYIAKIDSNLYKSYSDNDLRKKVFFVGNTGANAGTYGFQGGYLGSYYSGYIFDGMTTSELYLIRSECYAKANKVPEALSDLNMLLQTRWNKTVTYVPVTAINAADALVKIRQERRKELIYRNQRWSDLRRYNVEGGNITLTKIVNNITHTLPPNDLRWVCLIPQQEIDKGASQNLR